VARESTAAIRKLAPDVGLFAGCLFATLLAAHLMFLVGVDSANGRRWIHLDSTDNRRECE
jgi:hypothetical protein